MTYTSFSPSLLQLVLEEESISECSSLRTVTSGGEALSNDLVDLFYDRLTASLINRYGPTEATISVTSYLCRRGREGGRRSPSAGRDPGSQVLLLDQRLRPMPAGVSGGDLHRGQMPRPRISGPGPGATAERFIPQPLVFSAR